MVSVSYYAKICQNRKDLKKFEGCRRVGEGWAYEVTQWKRGKVLKVEGLRIRMTERQNARTPKRLSGIYIIR